MNDTRNQTKPFWRRYEAFCGILLLLAVAISLGEIVGRVVFSTTYDFIIDLSVWITIWAMLLMGGPLLAENGHVSIDFFRSRLQGKSRMSLEIFNALTTLIYGVTVTIGGILIVKQLYLRSAVFPRYFAIPKWIVELCIPLGMGIFTLFGIVEFIRILRQKS